MKSIFGFPLSAALAAGLFTLTLAAAPARAEDPPKDPKAAKAAALRAPQASTSLDVADKKITITFGQPSTDGKGYQSIKEGVPEGTIWRMGSNKATRIETPVDLKFGSVTVKAGAYSLWMRKTKDGWNLLFHPKDSTWGFPSPKDGFVAEAPMTVGKPKAEVKLLTIKLAKEGDNGGSITLEWGDFAGSIKFDILKP